jgi:hypothetical protein
MRVAAATVIACLAITACSDMQEKTTESPYSKREVADFENRAAANDLAALRELDIHYDLAGSEVERERIHQRRVALGEPESLDEEIFRRISKAEKLTDCEAKKRELLEARAMGIALGSRFKLNKPDQYPMVILTDRSLQRLDCK